MLKTIVKWVSGLVLLHQIFRNWLVCQFLLDEEALRSGPAISNFITKRVIQEFLSVVSLKVDLWPLVNSVL